MSAQWSRRQFAQSAGLAAASLAMPLKSWASKPKSKPKATTDRHFSIGIQSYSLRGYSTEEAIRHASELECEHMEFYPGQFSPKSTSEEIAAMKQTMKAAGMKMFGHGVNKFTSNDQANRRLFEFAKAAGIRNLTADPDPDSFESLDRLVKEFDIRIAIHNHGPHHRYNKAIDVLNACEPYDKRIGACADLGHFIRSGEDAVQVIRLLGDRLYGIHLKDFAEMQDKTHGVILGRGHLDVDGVFAALAHVNFPTDGCLSLEYEENKDNPIDDIRQCLKIAHAAADKVAG